ncbi:MAG: hypothetical protein HN726_04320 [Candidatus Magasanikbacteria bacterium]|nr:hypothetical protein [Candidatus Magasanikbacteria bacterium]MBT4220838.1 hypothetical protein [Candidatus Magasanikbacteria bacterium]MBT4350183.1 hypothetical protein [Candidatus Magasanikbacteria bacterium]MBT4541374.1 hypothetical protein [Candidatus Magasanikbacteria bacterium]MBT6253186.1 hypothetical protein [Candidatus Magasanikbacteria bacterium]
MDTLWCVSTKVSSGALLFIGSVTTYGGPTPRSLAGVEVSDTSVGLITHSLAGVEAFLIHHGQELDDESRDLCFDQLSRRPWAYGMHLPDRDTSITDPFAASLWAQFLLLMGRAPQFSKGAVRLPTEILSILSLADAMHLGTANRQVLWKLALSSLLVEPPDFDQETVIMGL